MRCGWVLLIAVLGEVVWGSPLRAGPGPAAKRGDDPLQGPLDIRSERLEVRHDRRQAVFEGRVTLSQGRLRITCQKLLVFYDSGREGKQVDRVSKMVFSGDVAITLDERRGHCQEAEYQRRSGRLVCRGNPWVVEGRNRVQGEQIEYLLREKVVRVTRPRAVLHLPASSAPPAKERPQPAEPRR